MQKNSTIHQVIANHARLQPKHVALRDANTVITYLELHEAINKQVDSWREHFTSIQPVIALAVENHPAWVILDLAALDCEIPLIPLPFFFSSSQWLHAIQNAGATILVTDHPELFTPLLNERINTSVQFELFGKLLTQFTFNSQHKIKLPVNTAKITYTSGTTGNPKGVCLSVNNMLNVAKSIADVTRLSPQDVHLNVLPLATLLENVAGIYAPLLAGATCVLLPSKDIGLSGASGLDITKLIATLNESKASTAIFTPELLHALVLHLETDIETRHYLRFLAVGGASVSPALLNRAKKLAIPVYEGYGLSECASVVALNVPYVNKIGSVGRLLAHVQLEFTEEGEIVVTGNAYLGYVGQEHTQQDKIYTGDIGYIDEDDFLFITGRKKNIFITSYGRNVSPDWVERELKISPFITQAALYGEAKPWNVAVVVPRQDASETQITTTIHAINADLPDYARIARWIIADEPFTLRNNQLTSNGRNRRDMIWKYYEDKINALYKGTEQ